jgi:membrane protein
LIQRIRHGYHRAIHLYHLVVGPDDRRRWLPAPIRATGRWFIVLYGELAHQRAFEKASALAYGSLVSLVPLLGLMFTSMRIVGADQAFVENVVFQTFLGDVPRVREVLVPGLVHLDVSALGIVGTLGWLWIAARIYMTMEATYSAVFHVRVSRSLPRRMLNFLLAFSVGPIFTAFTLFGTAQVSHFFKLSGLSGILAFLIAPTLLTFALRTLPCTHVRWGPALLGGCLSGALIELGATGFARYARLFSMRDPIVVVYGAIGLIPVFLLWLYLLWLFVLLGAVVAYVAQNYKSLVRAEAEQRREKAEDRKLPSVETAIELASTIALYWRRGETPVSEEILARHCKLPTHRIGFVLEVLQRGGLLREVEDGTWTLTRTPDQIAVREVADVWRANTNLRRKAGDPLSATLAVALKAQLDGSLDEASRTWVEGAAPPAPTMDMTDPGASVSPD